MKRFFTLLLAASCLTAVGQVPDYAPTEGLVGWYSLDDESLEESSLTPLNTPQFGLNRFGQEGACSVFDGNQELTTSGLDYEDFTISIWFKPSESAGDICHGLISQNEGVDCTPLMHVALCNIPAQLNCQVRYTSCMADKVECDYLSGQWQHLAFTREGSIIQVFWNGVVADENVAVDHTLSPQTQLRIGSLPYGGLFRGFEGDIDDVGIWSRTLTPDEILEIYYAPAPLMGCNDESACNFDSLAAIDDGSCHFNCEFCQDGTIWDEEIQGCISANTADINNDGCVQLSDLLDLLSAYGDCGAEESPWQCGDPLEYQGDDYETVLIGEQCWFAENLRSNYYSDGSLVESTQNNSSWANGNVGMICTYGNVASNEDLYGSLYNWYAVADVRGLCPTGWHVPEEVEWQNLIDSAGGTGVAGEILKSQDFWANGSQGNDALDFDGRPGGYRRYNGSYQTLGSKGYWWTSTAVNNGQATIFELNSTAAVATYPDLINGGFSIRCIKD